MKLKLVLRILIIVTMKIPIIGRYATVQNTALRFCNESW